MSICTKTTTRKTLLLLAMTALYSGATQAQLTTSTTVPTSGGGSGSTLTTATGTSGGGGTVILQPTGSIMPPPPPGGSIVTAATPTVTDPDPEPPTEINPCLADQQATLDQIADADETTRTVSSTTGVLSADSLAASSSREAFQLAGIQYVPNRINGPTPTVDGVLDPKKCDDKPKPKGPKWKRLTAAMAQKCKSGSITCRGVHKKRVVTNSHPEGQVYQTDKWSY